MIEELARNPTAVCIPTIDAIGSLNAEMSTIAPPEPPGVIPGQASADSIDLFSKARSSSNG